MNQSQKKTNFKISPWLSGILALIILVTLSINNVTLIRTNLFLDNKIAEAEEATRPADIDIVILNGQSCEDCFDIQLVIETIKQGNIKINSEQTVEMASSEGAELIKKYNITKAPALIITGELEKDSAAKDLFAKLGEIKDGAFVFGQSIFPYVLISSGEVKGRVAMTMLSDSSCAECYNVANHISILKQFGMPTANQKTVDLGSGDGKELINKYNIKLLPTIVLTGDIDAYPSFKKVWAQVGTVESDGAYVFKEGVKNMGAYKNLSTGRIITPVKQPVAQ